MRTKACIHTLTGHTNTVACVKCQAANPQVSWSTLCCHGISVVMVFKCFIGNHRIT